jgi:hypothetical protein
MKKDVIYIDIEDDITSIIEKIKQANAKIVALVPPKRTGALQSVVNLKLLQKAAANVDKRVVLITNDQALTALAAGVKIPVAKNLQSRPELAPVAALEVDETDVINGEELPIGDLAKTSTVSAAIANEEKPNINEAARTAGASLGASAAATPGVAKQKETAPKSSKGATGSKIPNFDTFRKKLFIFGGLGVLLIGFLVWAIVFAPSATVTITANTNAVNINRALSLDPNGEVDVEEGILKPEIKQIKKTVSTDFDTTGTKEVGDKAKGQVVFSNCETSYPQTVEQGDAVSVDGNNYIVQASTEVPGGQGSFGGPCIQAGESSPVTVVAQDIGEDYNVSSGTVFAVSGHDDRFTATASSDVSGGSKETVNIVDASDVEKARDQLKELDANAVREELSKQFDGNVVIINESFKSEVAEPNAVPAVGERAKQARLSAETTYTLIALPRSDVDALLANTLESEIKDNTGRRIYSNGNKTLSFNQFQVLDGGTYAVQLHTTGYVGPVINEDQLKQEIAGKRYGEIQQLVNNIEGVEDVNIQFSPFWVAQAPGPDKVNIKFTVKNNAQ